MAKDNDSEIAAKVLRGRLALKEKRLIDIDKMIEDRPAVLADIAALKRALIELGADKASQEKPSQIEVDFAPTGLTEAIRSVVSGSSAGLRPIEATKALEAKGWKQTGKTSLSARVAAEMARLARSGKLQAADGVYRAIGG